VLDGAGIATVPEDGLVDVLREALGKVPLRSVTDVDRLLLELPVGEVLGPATLAYLDEREFQAATTTSAVSELSPGHDDLNRLLDSVASEETKESGLAEITSTAFVVRDGDRVVAAAGYRRWTGEVAHMNVLTAPDHRGQGFAQAVASEAVVDALANRLLPQWRARSDSSRSVARALGFRQLGAQVSIRIDI
jgi:hypothetical protein